MLNINYGHNKELLNSCKRLHDYSYFIAKVNTYLDRKVSLNVAVRNAVNQCIEEDILADILIKCRSEVFNMLLTEYNERLHSQTMYNEGYEDGIREGIEKTAEMLKDLKLSDDMIIETISGKYDISKEDILKILGW